jgi:hypothetical protein
LQVFVLTALLSAIAGGCSGTPGFEYPTAKAVAVRIDEQTDQGVRVIVLVNMNNPNDYPLPLIEGSYTVNVSGLGSFHDGARSVRTLPSRGTETIEMPAAFATKGAPVVGRQYDVSGWITFQPPSNLRALMTDMDIPLPDVGFALSGVLQSAPASATPPTTAPLAPVPPIAPPPATAP